MEILQFFCNLVRFLGENCNLGAERFMVLGGCFLLVFAVPDLLLVERH